MCNKNKMTGEQQQCISRICHSALLIIESLFWIVHRDANRESLESVYNSILGFRFCFAPPRVLVFKTRNPGQRLIFTPRSIFIVRRKRQSNSTKLRPTSPKVSLTRGFSDAIGAKSRYQTAIWTPLFPRWTRVFRST